MAAAAAAAAAAALRRAMAAGMRGVAAAVGPAGAFGGAGAGGAAGRSAAWAAAAAVAASAAVVAVSASGDVVATVTMRGAGEPIVLPDLAPPPADASPLPGGPMTAAIEAAMPTLCKLEARGRGGSVGVGSAFVISTAGLIVSNDHVFSAMASAGAYRG